MSELLTLYPLLLIPWREDWTRTALCGAVPNLVDWSTPGARFALRDGSYVEVCPLANGHYATRVVAPGLELATRLRVADWGMTLLYLDSLLVAEGGR